MKDGSCFIIIYKLGFIGWFGLDLFYNCIFRVGLLFIIYEILE